MKPVNLRVIRRRWADRNTQVVQNTATGLNATADVNTYPCLLEVHIGPPETMHEEFVRMYGSEVLIKVRSKSRDNLERWARHHQLQSSHPQVRSFSITGPN